MRKIIKNGVAQIVKKHCSLNLGALKLVLLAFMFEFCACVMMILGFEAYLR